MICQSFLLAYKANFLSLQFVLATLAEEILSRQSHWRMDSSSCSNSCKGQTKIPRDLNPRTLGLLECRQMCLKIKRFATFTWLIVVAFGEAPFRSYNLRPVGGGKTHISKAGIEPSLQWSTLPNTPWPLRLKLSNVVRTETCLVVEKREKTSSRCRFLLVRKTALMENKLVIIKQRKRS